MVLETTPHEVVIKTMLDEKEKLDYFVRKESSKIAKLGTSTSVYYATYTNPKSRNTYLFWGGRIVTRTYFQKIGRDNFRSGSCLMVNTSDGGRMLYTLAMVNDYGKKARALIGFTAHFLKRYRERFNYPDAMPTEELISIFLNRNCEAIPLDYKKVIKKWEDHPDGAALQGVDGIFLGTQKKLLCGSMEFYSVMYNTYLSEDILKESQKEAMMTDEKIQEITAEFIREKVSEHPVLSRYCK